jgi:hypothetical protein
MATLLLSAEVYIFLNIIYRVYKHGIIFNLIFTQLFYTTQIEQDHPGFVTHTHEAYVKPTREAN